MRILGEEQELRYLLAAAFVVLATAFWDWSFLTGQITPRVPELYAVYSIMWCLMLFEMLFLLASFHSGRRRGLYDPVSKEHQDYDHGDVSDEWLWYDLRMTARGEKRPLGDVIGIIAMPDGRTAWEWVRERPRVLKAFQGYCIEQAKEGHGNGDDGAQGVLPVAAGGDGSTARGTAA
jgi:hypothetical protein